MTDHPLRGELRAVVPTLEPDEAFLAQLSARAAAGAMSASAARPAGGWRVALAPVAVAAVLVGIAWLTGVRPSGLTDPTPAPQPTDATTHASHSASPGTTSRPASATSPSRPTRATGAHPSTPAPPQGSAPAGPGPTAVTPPPPAPPQAAGNGQGAEHANGHANGHPTSHPTAHPTGKPSGLPMHPPTPEQTRAPDLHAGDHPAIQAGQDRHP